MADVMWANRIVGHGNEAPDQLLANPANWRVHPKAQQDALAGVLRDVGVVQSVIVNRRTGFLVDGHLRVSLAMRDGQPRIPVVYVDLNESEEALVLATLDPIGAAAATDGAKLEDLLRDVSTGDAAVQALLDGLTEGVALAPKTIVGHSDGYDSRDVHAGKLAYRVEAAWRAAGGCAVDLYSGQGQVAEWYGRRFDRVIRVDQHECDGIDHVMSAMTFLRTQLPEDFDFIDFDDEGSPLREVRLLFDVLPSARVDPFVLCVTDGSGLNLKLHGRFDPKLYGVEGSQRRATRQDYDSLEELVSGAVQRFAERTGWTAHQWSSVRGSEGNVVYQTFRIARTGVL